MDQEKKETEIVFVGGGHSHALTLRNFGMKPVPGVRITVISDVTHTPYSGMLPGHIAGLYSYDDIHIDLRDLCGFAGARFIKARVCGVDPDARLVQLQDRPGVAYDLLSINIGSTPETSNVPGAEEFAIPAKPVPELLQHWGELVAQVEADSQFTPRIVIVGGGVGGVELALCMQQRLNGRTKVAIVHAESDLLMNHNDGVRRRLKGLLKKRGIECHTGVSVTEVAATQVRLSSGDTLPCDRVFWVTQASVPEWLKASGLSVTENGFLSVRQTMQLESHDDIFAAGDVATIVGHPRQKSGVYAVRHAKPLIENLRAKVAGRTLTNFIPQKTFLALIGTATREAVASKGLFTGMSSGLWKLKDWIDVSFMKKFHQLPRMDDAEAEMFCTGCAAKAPADILTNAVLEHGPLKKAGVTDALEVPDDAAVVQIPEGMTLLQSVDYMPALMPDSWLFGRIAVIHSLSDVYAMGGAAHSVLVNVILRRDARSIQQRDLRQLMAGIIHELELAGAMLLGGHTSEGDELGVGVTVNGIVDPGKVWRKGALNEGDALILTKPLGTAMIFAAGMRRRTFGRHIDAAIASMLLSNRSAVEVLRQYPVTGVTDVTGFGLVGHLLEMLKPADWGATLVMDQLPGLPGTDEVMGQGIESSLAPDNRRFEEQVQFSTRERIGLLFDPQTSGGLLIGIAPDQADRCVADLLKAGYAGTKVIGRVMGKGDSARPITVT